MFAEPMIDSIPGPPPIPGMAEGKPFDSYKIEPMEEDGERFLRVIVFSGLDPASIYRDSGLDVGPFIPSFEAAAYWAHKISDLISRETPVSIAETFNGHAEYRFTW